MRWALRWGGLGLTVILPVAWGVSVFRGFTYVYPRGEWMIGAGRGAFRVVSEPLIGNWPAPAWMSGRAKREPMVWLPQPRSLSPGWLIDIPIWIFWLPAACLTAWRFKVDRMKPAHACQSCGYDRSGLVSSSTACPECGALPGGGQGG